MPLHTTQEPALRAHHIAEREAEETYRRTYSLDAFFGTYFTIHDTSLIELQPLQAHRLEFHDG